MRRTVEDLWEELERKYEIKEGLEMTPEEFARVTKHSIHILGPGDGLKIERVGNGNFLVSIW